MSEQRMGQAMAALVDDKPNDRIFLVMFDATISGPDAHRYARWVSSQVTALAKAEEEIRRLRDGIAKTVALHCGDEARESFDADAVCDELQELLEPQPTKAGA